MSYDDYCDGYCNECYLDGCCFNPEHEDYDDYWDSWDEDDWD